MKYDREGNFKNSATICFRNKESAIHALNADRSTELGGREIRVVLQGEKKERNGKNEQEWRSI